MARVEERNSDAISRRLVGGDKAERLRDRRPRATLILAEFLMSTYTKS